MRSVKKLPVLAVSSEALIGPPPGGASSIPAQFATPGLSLLQIVSILKAYRRHALLIAAAVIALTALVAKLSPKTYTATATLMVNLQQRGPLEGATNQPEPLGPFMATEIQLMQSGEVLLPVVDQLNLTRNSYYTNGYRGDGSNVRDWAKDSLWKTLDIEAGPAGSQLIYLTAAARSAGRAADVPNPRAEVYLTPARARRGGPASARAKRYSAELAELKNKVRAAQDQVTAFRQRTGAIETDETHTSIDMSLLASLETRLQEAENARRSAEVRAAGDPTYSKGAEVSVTIQALQSQLALEQAHLAQLQATLGPRHPQVIELQSQIDANRRTLSAGLQSLGAGASAELTSARRLEEKLRAAVEQQRAKVATVSRLHDEGTKFQLELESAQNVYKRALDGYDQIMFASDGHFNEISVVSRAVPPQKASRPNKIKMVLMGAMLGLGLGIVIPLGYELLLNRRVRCRDDFERDFSVPVLMEFERLAPAEEHA